MPTTSPLRRRAIRAVGIAAAGAVAGLAIFAVESALILRSTRGIVDWDATGTARDALLAAKPALAGILVRVALACSAAGALLSLAAAALAAQAARTRRGFRLLWAADAVALCALIAWLACVRRPALFDDVDALRPLVRFVMAHGEPWHAAAALLALFAVHLVRSQRPGRTLTCAAAGTAGFLAIGAAAPPPPPPRAFPLVVLIGLDAFRPDRVEGDRHVAPNLEAFLRDAVRFDRAYTPIAQTEPAWASLLSADWPFRTGVRHPLTAGDRRAALPTFAGIFSLAGYRTIFATDCSRFHWEPAGSGFDTRLQPPRGALNFVLEKLRYRFLGAIAANDLGSRWIPEYVENRALAGYYDPEGYARRLASLLVRTAAEGPTLFAFHGTAAHYPGDAVYPFYRRFSDAPLRMSYALPGETAQASARSQREELYDELLAEADAQLGILLDTLRAEGLYDRAFVVVFSDHGEGFHPGSPDLTSSLPVHGARLSDDENRILLAVKPPASAGIETGRTLHDLVRLIDVGPTLLDAAWLPPLPGADGVSLLPRLRGAEQPPLVLYAETGYTHVPPDAFDPAHFSGGARGLGAYRVRGDGVVEMSARGHTQAMREKDRGAFDGRGWLIEWRSTDGEKHLRCEGECSAELAAWFDGLPRRGRDRPSQGKAPPQPRAGR
jgi:hypothetical protein